MWVSNTQEKRLTNGQMRNDHVSCSDKMPFEQEGYTLGEKN